MVIHDGHQDMVTTIKDHVEKTEELYDTIVIAAEDQILVSYKVHHLNRFKMKSIEKKLEKWLQEKYPDKTVDLSSDYKIFLESHKLMTKWKNNEVTKEEAEKKLDKIVKLKNEMT
ncbi:sporulation protein [Jeotgalibacillus proteolyticus]|nr:sporulation protein [Jeotgalibacillus proteolyticus]